MSQSFELQTTSEAIKAIAFPVAEYLLALPIETVMKAIEAPPKLSAELDEAGLLYLSDRAISLLDLHRKLVGKTHANRRFLILAQLRGEYFAIPVDEPPTLVEIPVSEIRSLPDSYRHANALGIASHVAIVPQEKTILEIFILDPERL